MLVASILTPITAAPFASDTKPVMDANVPCPREMSLNVAAIITSHNSGRNVLMA
jgi:hypothetical protein